MRAITLIRTFIVLLVIGISNDLGVRSHDLKKNFYKDTCPHVEEIVRAITWAKVAINHTLIPKFLRMQFHDCFVRVRN